MERALSVPSLSAADVAAHVAASYVRPRRTVLASFPAGGPRGSWPAEEFAQQRRREGVAVDVVMDLDSDAFLVVSAEGDGKSSYEVLLKSRRPRPYPTGVA
ncbi:hypothetical protein FHS40_007463 [Streptomyces spectabilis]|uniref:Uncharacterized protein n=1 Tax=Streptomyces spectabilis TaxID=68270 RepID=A0A7W8EWU8_STRST|nr:hypothetical protein [Streptomyces spectabilis]